MDRMMGRGMIGGGWHDEWGQIGDGLEGVGVRDGWDVVDNL